jgi:two-component system, LytTR family, response regulator
LRIITHVIFWIGVLAFYTLYFGAREDEYGQAFLFVTVMLPITISTTYFIMYWLIPRYAMTRRFGWFSLYLCYTLLLSAYAELMLLVVLYITVADYQAMFVGPSVTDQLEVLSGMYVVVLVAVSMQLWKRLASSSSQNKKLLDERKETEMRLRVAESRLQHDTWQVRADRQTHRVPISEIVYVESVRDYVKIHRESVTLISKMKMLDAESDLADAGFLRVHRSFLVNPRHISSWSTESIVIGKDVIPIGRSYRSDIVRMLGAS